MIRAASREDAQALAGVHHRAWLRAFTEYVDPERFLTLEEHVARWQRILRQPSAPGRITLVFDQDGRPAGFASVGPGRDDDLGPQVGELMALYVDPPAQGAGVGGLLLAAAEQRLRADGFAKAVLWTFTRNEHARHVYERYGWTLEPGIAREDDWAPQVRYRRAL